MIIIMIKMLRANFLCFSLVPDALVIIPGSILAYFFSTRAQTQHKKKFGETFSSVSN